MSPREREVRQYATDLLAHLSVTTVPVDPVRIARRQRLAVAEGPLPDGSGRPPRLEETAPAKRMIDNVSLADARQRVGIHREPKDGGV